MNADVLQDVDLRGLARAHAQSGAKLTLALTRLPDARESYREIQVNSDGRITGYGEKKRGALFYTGVGILDPSLVEPISPERPSDFVREILDPAIRRGEAYAVEHSGLWMDLGSPELWAQAHFDLMHALESGSVPERIRARVDRVSMRVRDGFWVSRNFSRVPTGEFEQVYLGNGFYRGSGARRSVWYGNSSCRTHEPERSWIAHGRHIQALS
jgi:NDP-sugar pyrophosphorylase family protein